MVKRGVQPGNGPGKKKTDDGIPSFPPLCWHSNQIAHERKKEASTKKTWCRVRIQKIEVKCLADALCMIAGRGGRVS